MSIFENLESLPPPMQGRSFAVLLFVLYFVRPNFTKKEYLNYGTGSTRRFFLSPHVVPVKDISGQDILAPVDSGAWFLGLHDIFILFLIHVIKPMIPAILELGKKIAPTQATSTDPMPSN